MAIKIFYSHKEELWNAYSHAIGIVLGVATGAILLPLCATFGNKWAVIGVSLYLFGMLSSYISSTVYHSLSAYSRWKGRVRKLDHATIYWHIAGSYSPITLIALRQYGAWGWALFSFVWACAIVGTAISFARLRDHSNAETLCFIAMGLCMVVAFRPLLDHVRPSVLLWIAGEGVCFITGAAFYSLNKRRYMHSVFHFFVLGGSVCHVISVANLLNQYLPGVVV